MFALRVVGLSWYSGPNVFGGPTVTADLQGAVIYKGRAAVEEAALLLASACPYYLGKLAVRRIRHIRVQKRTARVVEWEERTKDGKKVRVPAKTVIDREWVGRYITK